MINAIAHATDFSSEGRSAFAHAVRLALVHRCRLDLLHVRDPAGADGFDHFPRVRELLAGWGVLPSGASVADIATQTGITVRKVEIRDADTVIGLSRFLISHRPDLLIVASHGREGWNRWLSGSVSGEIAQQTRLPTLLLGPNARPFVDLDSGALNLTRILVPVDHGPSPGRAVRILDSLIDGLRVETDFVHAGPIPPEVRGWSGTSLRVRTINPPVIEAIVAEAQACHAQLIAMPTSGRRGFLDGLRGSTTEPVVARAHCPVLALPA